MPSSSPPALPLSSNEDLEAHLDSQILHIRAEIAKLRARKARLSAALLASSRVQKSVQQALTTSHALSDKQKDTLKRSEDTIDKQKRENDIKVHRLCLGVTAFPFRDVDPTRAQGEKTMLGVRFDLPRAAQEDSNRTSGTDIKQENDQQTDPFKTRNSYFLLLRKLHYSNKTYLKVHQHNIPAHIDVDEYAEEYLQLPPALEDQDDEAMDVDQDNSHQAGRSRTNSEIFEDDSGIDVTQDIQMNHDENNTPSGAGSTGANVTNNGQELHTFTRRIKEDLTAWYYRNTSIHLLQQELNLSSPPTSVTGDSFTPSSQPLASRYSISQITQLTHDAHTLRIIWTNGSLGHLRIGYDGTVERAAAYGPDPVVSSLQMQRKFVKSTDASGERGRERRAKDASDLSELEIDGEDESGFRRLTSRSKGQDGKRGEEFGGREVGEAKVELGHVRLHEVERLLTSHEDGEKVLVYQLAERLKVVDERVFGL